MSKSTGKKGTFYHQRIHALSLADGSEMAGSPVEVQASFPGKGPGNDGAGHVIFKPADYKERSALLLHNNVVYTAWSSHCDMAPYTGCTTAYQVHSLAQLRPRNLCA